LPKKVAEAEVVRNLRISQQINIEFSLMSMI